MYFYGGRNLVSFFNGLANFTKIAKLLSYILHNHCSIDFKLAASLIILEVRAPHDNLIY